MKVEMPNSETVIINDGDYVIARNQYGQYVLGFAQGLRPIFEGEEEEDTGQYFDPVPYLGGDSFLPVDQSAKKACIKIYQQIWEPFNATEKGDVNLLLESVTAMISEGMGRQATYVLAGGIKKGFREAGLYRGVPLAYVFKGFADGVIEEPQEEPASVSNFKYPMRDA